MVPSKEKHFELLLWRCKLCSEVAFSEYATVMLTKRLKLHLLTVVPKIGIT